MPSPTPRSILRESFEQLDGHRLDLLRSRAFALLCRRQALELDTDDDVTDTSHEVKQARTDLTVSALDGLQATLTIHR